MSASFFTKSHFLLAKTPSLGQSLWFEFHICCHFFGHRMLVDWTLFVGSNCCVLQRDFISLLNCLVLFVSIIFVSLHRHQRVAVRLKTLPEVARVNAVSVVAVVQSKRISRWHKRLSSFCFSQTLWQPLVLFCIWGIIVARYMNIRRQRSLDSIAVFAFLSFIFLLPQWSICSRLKRRNLEALFVDNLRPFHLLSFLDFTHSLTISFGN